MDKITKAGYLLTTPVIITNSDDFNSVTPVSFGATAVLDRLINVEK